MSKGYEKKIDITKEKYHLKANIKHCTKDLLKKREKKNYLFHCKKPHGNSTDRKRKEKRKIDRV